VVNFAATYRQYCGCRRGGGIRRPITELWKQGTCYIADPEGNLIEVGSFKERRRRKKAASWKKTDMEMIMKALLLFCGEAVTDGHTVMPMRYDS